MSSNESVSDLVTPESLVPPEPPECRISCGACGYTESESEYHHPYCGTVIAIICLAVTVVGGMFGMTVYNIVRYLNVVS